MSTAKRLFSVSLAVLSAVVFYGCPPSGIPTAAFTVDVRYGKAPLTVQFTDQSLPGDSAITAWKWKFGDTEESTAQNPVHIYAKTGNYTVTLTVTNSRGQHSIEKKAYIIAGNIWARHWGGAAADTCSAACRTKDGDYVLVGSTTSAGAGGSDIYVVKLNANGEELWKHTYGEATDEFGYAVLETSDEELLIAGAAIAAGRSDNDAYLLRIDGQGVEQWHNTYGGGGSDIFYDLTATADGNYLLVGDTRSYGPDFTDAYLAKVDNDGDPVSGWPKHIAGPGRNIARAVCRISDGFALAGYSSTATSGINNDIYLAKIDASGAVTWEKTYGGVGDDRGYDLIEGTSGFVVLGSYSTSTLTSVDMVLVNFDTKGTFVSATTFGGTRREEGHSLIAITGGYLLFGSTSSYGSGETDLYLVKANTNGETLWTRTFGGPNADTPAQVFEHSGFVICGTTASYGSGDKDFYIIRTNLDGYGPTEPSAAPLATVKSGASEPGWISENATDGEGVLLESIEAEGQ